MPANQVSVSTSATLLTSRQLNESVIVENNGTTAVYIGTTDAVTTSTGFLLPGILGAALTVDQAGPLYGIVASGTQTVSVFEVSR